MISTILRVNWLLLRHDPVAQMITMVVPIFFFSIFALIFGGSTGEETPQVAVALVDEAATPASLALTAALSADPSLAISHGSEDGTPYERDGLRLLVSEGSLPVAVVIPEGFVAFGEGPPVILLTDASDPVAPKMVEGLLQAAAFRAAPRLAASDPPAGDGSGDGGDGASAAETEPAAADEGGLIRVDVIDVVGRQQKNPAISFYAASTGVMFLLFTISASAGTLLDEEQKGVLDRLLASNLSMGGLLFGKWLYLSLQGFVQVTLMFIWGSLVFGLQLWTPRHLAGFTLMTVVTAVSASAFGLVLATACRTRAQLGGVSTILVLTMSVVGGSLFPRYLMPEWLQMVGLATFNAWALDGYQKVFWYDRPLLDLWPQVTVLVGVTLVFLAVSRRLARRWEAI